MSRQRNDLPNPKYLEKLHCILTFRLVSRWRNRYQTLAKKKYDSISVGVALEKVFNDDQLELLSGKIRKVKQWSEATVMESMQIRFACQGGYDKLIKRGYPFPSTRTLMRRISDIRFSPGKFLRFCMFR